jgi:hypothetical protein
MPKRLGNSRYAFALLSFYFVHFFDRKKTNQKNSCQKQLAGAFFPASPAFGDVDGDGDLEIAVNAAITGEQFLFHHTGEAVVGWPISIYEPEDFSKQSTTNTRISMGDVDNDGLPEVIRSFGGITTDAVRTGNVEQVGGVYAWNGDGSLVEGFPLTTELELFILENGNRAGKGHRDTPILTDIDNDGLLDIMTYVKYESIQSSACESYAEKLRDSVYIWGTDIPYNPQRLPWPRFQHDAGLTGRFE